jgi:hypothetical protein
MKTKRIAQILGTTALLTGGYVWWRGRRIGLVLMGGGFVTLALSRMPKHRKIALKIAKPGKKKIDPLTQLLAERNPCKINDLKAQVYLKATVKDVQKLMENGYFANAQAKLNAAQKMPEEAKRYLLLLALQKSDNNIALVLKTKLSHEEKSEELCNTLTDYAQRAKCTVEQRIELAERMLAWGCAQEQVAAVLFPYLADVLSRKPELIAQVPPNWEAVCEAFSQLKDPFPTLFAFLKTDLFDKLVQKIEVTAEKYEAAVNGKIDGTLSNGGTAETRELHVKWLKAFFALAPKDFDKWPTKTELLKRDDLKQHMVPLICSLRKEVWEDDELQKIGSSVPALVFVQMSKIQQEVVRPKLDQFVKTQVKQLDE